MKQTYATGWRPGRRSLLGAGIALAGAAARPVWAQGAVNLNFAVWGNRAEEEAFRRLIAGYTAQHPNVSIRLELNGSSAQLYQQVDTRLAGRQAPDPVSYTHLTLPTIYSV